MFAIFFDCISTGPNFEIVDSIYCRNLILGYPLIQFCINFKSSLVAIDNFAFLVGDFEGGKCISSDVAKYSFRN